MSSSSRIGVVIISSVMLLYGVVPDLGGRKLSGACPYPYFVQDQRRGELLPLALCLGAPRLRARTLLRRLGGSCANRSSDALWLAAGDLLEVRRGCISRRAQLAASRRLAFGLRLDINRATLEDLEALPRIGPALARRIVGRRRRVGPFSSVDELREVRGIGVRTVARLRPYVRCRGDARNAR